MGNVLKPLGSDDFPTPLQPPTYDQLLGFPNGRKERVMIATEQEMRAAHVPKYFRDYCAHKYLEIMACQRLQFPFLGRCKHKQEEYNECEVQDASLRMQEYERERRLRRRQKKKGEAMKVVAA